MRFTLGLKDGIHSLFTEDEMISHLEVTFVDTEYERASLENRITAEITSIDTTLPIDPLELQIAYKRYLSAQNDFEDAVHLYSMFEETPSTPELQRRMTKIRVENEYEHLRRE